MTEPLRTPGQTVGPFFGFALPYAGGGELVPSGSPGAVELHGTVYDGAGVPVPDALVELRQADPSGAVPTVQGSLARAGVFTGWGRAATGADGRYVFTTLEPGPTRQGAAAYVALVVFARGLLDRLFTRAYLPGDATAADPFLSGLDPDLRDRLVAARDPDGSLRFDIYLQGERETPFLTFPGHR